MTKNNDDILHVEGWTVDPKEVRAIASKMDIPTSTPLPEVIIIGEEQEEYFRGGPQIQKSLTKDSPSGYFITVPEKMLKRVGKDDYVLGPTVREDLRHELAHYEEYLKGGHVGQEDDPYDHAVKEISADLRAGTRNMSLALARQAGRLVEGYNLSDEEALKTVSKAARDLGISSRVVSRMYKLSESI